MCVCVYIHTHKWNIFHEKEGNPVMCDNGDGPWGHYAKWDVRLACVLVLQSCQTLCNAMDCSPPGSPVHGIFQARILEWVTYHALLQGIFPIQGSNPSLLHRLHWQADSLLLAPSEKPEMSDKDKYYCVIYLLCGILKSWTHKNRVGWSLPEAGGRRNWENVIWWFKHATSG